MSGRKTRICRGQTLKGIKCKRFSQVNSFCCVDHQNQCKVDPIFGSPRCVLGLPVLYGPIDLYHGLSNFNQTMCGNIDLLHTILNSGFLFPTRINTIPHSLRMYQRAVQDATAIETTKGLFSATYPDHWKRLQADDPQVKFYLENDLPLFDSVDVSEHNIRRLTNWFSSGIHWQSYYTRCLTLHFHLTNVDLYALQQQTYGDFVLYGELNNYIKMPQHLPIKYLTSIFVNPSCERALTPLEEAEIKDHLNRVGLAHVTLQPVV